MSLAIDVDAVTAVLLPDGWHTVDWDSDLSTFDVDAFELIRYGASGEPGERRSVIYSVQLAGEKAGVTFRENDDYVYAPLTSVLAVKEEKLHD